MIESDHETSSQMDGTAFVLEGLYEISWNNSTADDPVVTRLIGILHNGHFDIDISDKYIKPVIYLQRGSQFTNAVSNFEKLLQLGRVLNMRRRFGGIGKTSQKRLCAYKILPYMQSEKVAWLSGAMGEAWSSIKTLCFEMATFGEPSCRCLS